MFSCRAAWRKCGPLARRATYRLPQNVVQQRLMSSVPGGSGENIFYIVLCGGVFVGAISYAYSTMSTDRIRYNERIAQINAQSKAEWVPKPWPPKSGKEEEEEEEEEVAAREAELGEEDGAADSKTETVVEAVDEVVAEVAEVVEGSAEVVQDVQTVTEEVAGSAEGAAQADAEPAAIAAEEPKSKGMTSSEKEAVASEA
uniref:protein MGARP n=1 Tax=Monopterus albus TaxID=43700 RepID=UPI0009B4D8C1|nr:protein MGARP [Monopterus albus]